MKSQITYLILILFLFGVSYQPNAAAALSLDVSRLNADGVSFFFYPQADLACLYKYASGKPCWHVWLSKGNKLNYQGSSGWWGSTGYSGDKVAHGVILNNEDVTIRSGQIGKIVIKGARSSSNQQVKVYDWSGRLLILSSCSTGRNSATRLGKFTVVKKRLVMISFSGTLYARYPIYFTEHSAIHGWPRSVGTHQFYQFELLGRPASAGCVRIPEEVAKALWCGSVVGRTRVEVLP